MGPAFLMSIMIFDAPTRGPWDKASRWAIVLFSVTAPWATGAMGVRWLLRGARLAGWRIATAVSAGMAVGLPAAAFLAMQFLPARVFEVLFGGAVAGILGANVVFLFGLARRGAAGLLSSWRR